MMLDNMRVDLPQVTLRNLVRPAVVNPPRNVRKLASNFVKSTTAAAAAGMARLVVVVWSDRTERR